MNKLKTSKIMLAIFIINNLFIYIVRGYSAAMFHINLFVLGYGALDEAKKSTILSLCFIAFELVLIILLFIKKSVCKLIANIVFELLFFVDIYFCIISLINEWHTVDCIIEIALNLIFIGLILFDIIITYKTPKQEL